MGLHKIQMVLLVILFIVFVADITVTTKNELFFERFICPKTRPESLFQNYTCTIKYINRKELKFAVIWNITKPLYQSWIHGVLYYKFNGLTYQKFPVDLWENMCDWMSGKKKAYILDWTFGRVMNYSNFNHTCPFYGYYFINISRIPADYFAIEPLIPSGRYRFDADFTEGIDDPIPFTKLQIYFSVSDHRLEVI